MSAADKRCGTCRLWADNHYKQHFMRTGHECCADVAMDLPASWNNQMAMLPDDGADCPIWEAVEAPAADTTNVRDLRQPGAMQAAMNQYDADNWGCE